MKIQCARHWQQRLRYLANMWEYNKYGIDKRDWDTSQIMIIQCVWHWQQRLRYLPIMWEYNVYGIDNRDSDSSQKREYTICTASTIESQIPRKYVRKQSVWHLQTGLRFPRKLWEYKVYGIDKRDSVTSQICEMCVSLTTETQILPKYVRVQCVWHRQQRFRYHANMWDV